MRWVVGLCVATVGGFMTMEANKWLGTSVEVGLLFPLTAPALLTGMILGRIHA